MDYLYGEIQVPGTTLLYTGGTTETAAVTVDNLTAAITADVLKTPHALTVTDSHAGVSPATTSSFDGSAAVSLASHDYSAGSHISIALDAATGLYAVSATGLQEVITPSAMLLSDLVSDSGAAHLFASASEKANWNAKISGTSLVSAFQAAPDDAHVPSEKLMYDQLSGKQAALGTYDEADIDGFYQAVEAENSIEG